jgi:hypothetical protein
LSAKGFARLYCQNRDEIFLLSFQENPPFLGLFLNEKLTFVRHTSFGNVALFSFAYSSKHLAIHVCQICNKERMLFKEMCFTGPIQFLGAVQKLRSTMRREGVNHKTYIRIDITSPHGVRQKYEVLKPVLIYKPWSRGLML